MTTLCSWADDQITALLSTSRLPHFYLSSLPHFWPNICLCEDDHTLIRAHELDGSFEEKVNNNYVELSLQVCPLNELAMSLYLLFASPQLIDLFIHLAVFPPKACFATSHVHLYTNQSPSVSLRTIYTSDAVWCAVNRRKLANLRKI